jgi:hypothetical protein
MKARSFRLKVGGSFRVTIITEEFTEQELKWIREQGEPDIALGGVIADGDPNEFTIDTSYAKVRTGLVFPGKTETFDPAVDEDAEIHAGLWETHVLDGILAAMLALKEAASEGFNGETVVTPSYS